MRLPPKRSCLREAMAYIFRPSSRATTARRSLRGERWPLSSAGGTELCAELRQLLTHIWMIGVLREDALEILAGHALLPLRKVVLSPLG
jgi:hypothetical protein